MQTLEFPLLQIGDADVERKVAEAQFGFLDAQELDIHLDTRVFLGQ